eukprot:7103352-Prorocentrum_lima.AAC.1
MPATIFDDSVCMVHMTLRCTSAIAAPLACRPVHAPQICSTGEARHFLTPGLSCSLRRPASG